MTVSNIAFSKVSTHSRPKAAGNRRLFYCYLIPVSTHSRPKAAGWDSGQKIYTSMVSTHSRPKAAGSSLSIKKTLKPRFNTQPPEGGWGYLTLSDYAKMLFQHTAARRRLGRVLGRRYPMGVSTHSRPKAAGVTYRLPTSPSYRFNTQPPEGGWRPPPII